MFPLFAPHWFLLQSYKPSKVSYPPLKPTLPSWDLSLMKLFSLYLTVWWIQKVTQKEGYKFTPESIMSAQYYPTIQSLMSADSSAQKIRTQSVINVAVLICNQSVYPDIVSWTAFPFCSLCCVKPHLHNREFSQRCSWKWEMLQTQWKRQRCIIFKTV